MDLLTEIVAVALAALSWALVAIAGAASLRYRDSRFALVAGGLGVVGVVGALAAVHELSPRYGSAFGIAAIPLFLLLLAVGLIYAALMRRAPRAPTS